MTMTMTLSDYLIEPPKKNTWLTLPDNISLRITFVASSIVLFTVLGMQYYSFPMWLNQIVADNQNLSREDLAVLGGSTYIALGIFGGLLIGFKKIVPDRHHAFQILSTFAAFGLSMSWGLLYWLSTTSTHVRDHAMILVSLMVIIAFSVGVFYMIWFGETMRLIDPRLHFVYIAVANIVFSGGAAIILCARLSMGSIDWMFMMFLLVAGSVIFTVSYALYFQNQILAPDLPAVPGRQSDHRLSVDSATSFTFYDVPPSDSKFGFEGTCTLIKDLLFWKHLEPTADCDVTSMQFYFILGSYILVSCMSTTFMANLGALITEASSDDDTDDVSDHRQHTTVLIYSAVGQTVGRIFVAAAQYYADHATADEANVELRLMRVRNRSILPITLIIAALFLLSLLFLRFVDTGLDFTTASTLISGAYGMMWGITSNYPCFIAKYDFSTLLSFMQICGAMGTLLMTGIVAGLELDNTGVFTLLFIASTCTATVTIIALVLRINAEPKAL